MKRLIAMILMIALLVTAAGCAGGDAEPTGKEKLPKQTEATESSQPEQTDTLTVEQLRQQMDAEGKSFAVAYLGYITYDHDTVWDFIDKLGEEILQQMPFLQQIPKENVSCNAPQGEVYCIIPADSRASFKVYTGGLDMSGESTDFDDEVFSGSGEKPYLLVCNTAASPDSEIVITDRKGNVTTWNPKLDEYLFVEQPRYANGTTGTLDISPYNELLLAYYEDMQEDRDWDIPTKADLENTAWYWDGYTQDGNYYEYRVSFHEDDLDVQWNHGYGETQKYMSAQWTYEDDDVGVLTIDFENLAGVRKYNVLINWEENSMYIALDATGEILSLDYEPQYCFLIPAREETSAMALVGNWERTQTEVDGYTEESPAGEVMIRITGTTEDDLRIDYEDTQSSFRSFSDRAIFIMPGEDFMGVGEVEWVGQINYTGESANDSYMLVIVDGELILRHIFTVDGTRMVSYQTFRRVE